MERTPARYSDDVLLFWKDHSHALLSLAVPSGFSVSMFHGIFSASRMHVFYTIGLISDGKRSSIGPEKLNKVSFIHDNFKYTV